MIHDVHFLGIPLSSSVQPLPAWVRTADLPTQLHMLRAPGSVWKVQGKIMGLTSKTQMFIQLLTKDMVQMCFLLSFLCFMFAKSEYGIKM